MSIASSERGGRGVPVAGDDFTDFVRGRSTALLRTAVLLTGGDRGHAEDLLQGVLERMYLRWPRIDGSAEAYARRALVHASVNRWRGRRRRPELPLLDPDPPLPGGDDAATVDLRDALVRQRRPGQGLPRREPAEPTAGCPAVRRGAGDLGRDDPVRPGRDRRPAGAGGQPDRGGRRLPQHLTGRLIGDDGRPPDLGLHRL
ncbi:MAG: sigma factor, partial [Mycobacteriales bacterium]